MSESTYKEACNVYSTCGEASDDYEETCTVSSSGVSAVRRTLDIKNATGTSEDTSIDTDDSATDYIPGVGMRKPSQSPAWTSAVKKTISVLSLVLNFSLLAVVIILGVTVLNLKLSVSQLEENTGAAIADLSNVIERLQKTLRMTESISEGLEEQGKALGKRLTDSNLPGILESERQILQRLQKLEGNIKDQQNKPEEVQAATDRPLSSCPNGYQKYREVCYKAFDTRKNFHQSATTCIADGGTLAMPRNSGINAFLISLIQEVDMRVNFWFGLHDLREDGRWEWIDGTGLDGTNFSMWSKGRQPSKNYTEVQNCAVYWWIDQYSWNDYGCLGRCMFLCQIVLQDAANK